jgi:hypothetical protein
MGDSNSTKSEIKHLKSEIPQKFLSFVNVLGHSAAVTLS